MQFFNGHRHFAARPFIMIYAEEVGGEGFLRRRGRSVLIYQAVSNFREKIIFAFQGSFQSFEYRESPRPPRPTPKWLIDLASFNV